MRDFLSYMKDKFTIPLLYLIVPLEGLPFLFDSNSTIGKLLLIAKFGLLVILYFLYAEEIHQKHHAIMGLLTIALLISIFQNGGIGVFLLLVILFLSFILFPKIQLSEWHRKTLSLLLGLTSFGIFMYAIATPIMHRDFLKHSAWFITYYGLFNPNTYGYLSLTSFFYLITFFDPLESSKNRWISSILCILTIVFIILAECRAALLILFMFLLGYFANLKKLIKPYIYYIGVTIIMSFCIVYCYIWDNFGFSQEMNINCMFGKDFFSGRQDIWKIAFDGFLNKPLFGNGSHFLLEQTRFESAHNVLLGILVIVGIVPTLCYAFYMFSPKYLLGIKGKWENSLTVPQLCFLAGIISTAFECSYTDSRLNFLFLPMLLLTHSNKEPIYQSEKRIYQLNAYRRWVSVLLIVLIGTGFAAGAYKQKETIYFDGTNGGNVISEDIHFAKMTQGAHISDKDIVFRDTYAPTSGVSMNQFNAVQIQLLTIDGEFLETVYSGTQLGNNEGMITLPTGMETGLYYIRLKGNSNYHDECADVLAKLEKGSHYIFTFDIQKLLEKEVVIADYTILKE